MGIFFEPAIIIELFSSFFHTLPECIIIVYILRETVFEPLRHDIFHSEFIRRHSDGTCHIIRMALHGKHSLRDAISSHGSGSDLVCKYRICIRLDIRTGIKLRKTSHPFCRNAVPVGCIAALIREAFKLPRCVCAVRPHIRNNMKMDRMAHPGGGKGLFP